ncbi:hypothetical protein ACRALDRAFT_205080 [Sodiomyces alcalophilus JCM 7366]|uniref:uncharacterized protein n=1 Tax=Sodiomyces alcalophilus JCM 7366 TaxID=591952 RepID=UPI0039B4D1A7
MGKVEGGMKGGRGRQDGVNCRCPASVCGARANGTFFPSNTTHHHHITTTTVPLPNMAQPPSTLTKSLLARAHSPDSASRIFDDKIQYRSFYLRPSSPPPHDAREARRKARKERSLARSKQKPAPLSARARRRLGLYDLPRDRQRYALYEPLLGLWRGYIRELLGNELYTGGQAAAAKLSAAEMHGAEVEVVRSSCPSRVGIRGIVVKDARFVFEIVTPRDHIKIVPKEGTMFRVELPLEDPPESHGEKQQKGQPGPETQDQAMSGTAMAGEDATAARPRKFAFEILGDQFLHRGADRANKKFKTHFLKKDGHSPTYSHTQNAFLLTYHKEET